MRTISIWALSGILTRDVGEFTVVDFVGVVEAHRLSRYAARPGIRNSNNARGGVLLGISNQAGPDEKSAEDGFG